MLGQLFVASLQLASHLVQSDLVEMLQNIRGRRTSSKGEGTHALHETRRLARCTCEPLINATQQPPSHGQQFLPELIDDGRLVLRLTEGLVQEARYHQNLSAE
jgi:hypothetical protein